MKILEITSEKGSLYHVTLDDGETELWLHADLIAAEHLRKGQELSDADISYLREKAALHRSYEYALYCLERRGYSYRELYDKLMSAKHAEEPAVLETLEKLVRLGFLNDALYAQNLARTYIESRHYGIRRAELEMRRRGLSQEDIDAALEVYDDAEQISQEIAELLAKKYARQLTDADDRKAIDRVTASLLRRGFAYSDIRSAINAWFAEDDA